MTEENKKLRDQLKAAENVIISALRSQPDEDDACTKHLQKALVEVATIVRPAFVGNAAKWREALIDVVKRLEACVGCDHHTFHPTATTCDGITSVGKCGKVATCATIFKARAALAAPPRNCDKYSHDEALNIWAAENEDERNGCFDEWLYHEATEQEGDNDGSK